VNNITAIQPHKRGQLTQQHARKTT